MQRYLSGFLGQIYFFKAWHIQLNLIQSWQNRFHRKILLVLGQCGSTRYCISCGTVWIHEILYFSLPCAHYIRIKYNKCHFVVVILSYRNPHISVCIIIKNILLPPSGIFHTVRDVLCFNLLNVKRITKFKSIFNSNKLNV